MSAEIFWVEAKPMPSCCQLLYFSRGQQFSNIQMFADTCMCLVSVPVCSKMHYNIMGDTFMKSRLNLKTGQQGSKHRRMSQGVGQPPSRPAIIFLANAKFFG